MRVLSYSPSIEAYVAVTGKGGAVEYYDISEDIIDCSVSRQENAPAAFNIKLQNRNGKYNNLFTPMDRITIYAAKRESKHQLLTGYISTVSRFTLYPQDFTMSGFCSLYKLQNTWWDSGLVSSYNLIADESEMSISSNWTNYSSLIYKLVCVVGGMPSNILVGDVPKTVVEWARELFAAKQTDYDDIKSRVEAFYQMLGTTNGTVSASSASAGGGGGTASSEIVEKAVRWMIEKVSAGDIVYSQAERNLKEPKGKSYDCSSFVITGFYAAGLDVDAGYTGNMRQGFIDAGFTWIPGNRFESSDCQRGDILLKEFDPGGHVQVYIGNNQDVNCGGTPASVQSHAPDNYGRGWDGILRWKGKK